MLREIDLSVVSDGKLYTANDLVKADCGGCKGCSECCRTMADTIILDPWDVYHLTTGLNVTFEALLQKELELKVVDGIVLPYLKMQPDTNACAFLNEEGLCGIHAIRPGFCRLFPLGRIYTDKNSGPGFHYFLQIHECPKPNKTKVKIKKWLGIPDLKQYEAYITDWHSYLKQRQIAAMNPDSDAEIVKTLSMDILRRFYLTPYRTEDFYQEFYHRLKPV